jgi:hypothetical protein
MSSHMTFNNNNTDIQAQLDTIIKLELVKDTHQPPLLTRSPNNAQIDGAVFELMLNSINSDGCATMNKYGSFYAKNKKYYVYDAIYFGWWLVSIDQNYAIKIDIDITSMLERIIEFEKKLPFFTHLLESDIKRDLFFPTNHTISKHIRNIAINLSSSDDITCDTYYQSICRRCSAGNYMYYVYKSHTNGWWIVNTTHQYAKNIDSLVAKALTTLTPKTKSVPKVPDAPKKRRLSSTERSITPSKKLDFH